MNNIKLENHKSTFIIQEIAEQNKDMIKSRLTGGWQGMFQ